VSRIKVTKRVPNTKIGQKCQKFHPNLDFIIN
jgi:hypothetical protein